MNGNAVRCYQCSVLLSVMTFITGMAMDSSMMPVDQPMMSMDQAAMAMPPTPDVMQQQPSAPPVPAAFDASQQQPGAAPAAPVSDVPSTQFGAQDDTIELKEEQGGMLQSNDPQIVIVFKQAGEVLEKMDKVSADMSKQRATLSESYAQLDAILDEFFQSSSFEKGIVQESGKSVEAVPAQPTPAAPAQQESLRDLDPINQQVQAISQDKNSLKQSLALIDKDVEDAKTIVQQAGPRSSEILKQTNVAAANAILAELKQSQAKLEQMLQNLMATSSTNVQSMVTKIQSAVHNVKTSIEQLKAKGIALQAIEIEKQKEVQPESGEKRAVFRTWLIREKADAGAKTAGSETFVHYIFNLLADVVTGAFKIMYDTFSWMKERVTGVSVPTQISMEVTKVSTSQSTPAQSSATTPAVPVPAAAGSNEQQAVPTQMPQAQPQQDMQAAQPVPQPSDMSDVAAEATPMSGSMADVPAAMPQPAA